MLHVPASTLRYYDKEGLLPSVERTSGGIRMFKDDDIEWLRIIDCLKRPGCRSDIREYIALQRRDIRRSMRDCSFLPSARDLKGADAGTAENAGHTRL